MDEKKTNIVLTTNGYYSPFYLTLNESQMRLLRFLVSDAEVSIHFEDMPDPTDLSD